MNLPDSSPFALSAIPRRVRELYGLEVVARPLPGELDLNFHLRATDGGEWVLKVMHPERERGLIDLQCQALVHLAGRRPDLDLPRVRPTLAGDLFTAVEAAGAERWVWLLRYVPGRPLARVRPHPTSLLASLGRYLGEIDTAWLDFDHPAAHRELPWDVARAGWIRGSLDALPDASRRGLVERFLDLYEAEAVPRLPALRASVIHGDANDHNVLVAVERGQAPLLTAVIDLGDMVWTRTVCEPAVAAAYAVLGERDPLAAMVAVVAGYHAALPLTEAELAVLFPLLAIRLSVSVVTSAVRQRQGLDDPYVTISEAPAWAALERLRALHPRLAHSALRAACGLPAHPRGERVVRHLRAAGATAAPVLGIDPRTAPVLGLDLSSGSRLLGADPAATGLAALTAKIFGAMDEAGATIGVGRYDEARRTASGPVQLPGEPPTAEPKAVHLGLDLFVAPGTAVHAPLAGRVHALASEPAPRGRGPWLILAHETADGDPFFTLYAQLGADLDHWVRPGQALAAGERVATVGEPPGNGGGAPHLHFQVILDLLDDEPSFPTLCRASERATWKGLCPDPNLLVGIPAERIPALPPARDELLDARRRLTGGSVRLSYRQPLAIVRGFRQYLFDDAGRAYLDVYNNVPHVGHQHPRVVRAVAEQTALLTTNTRYLHENLLRYAERLTALLPAPLRVCYFLNSGSEANELAVRIARTVTGAESVIVLEAAYHGHTGRMIEASPYKFTGKLAGPGGSGSSGAGRQPWVEVAPLPDDYRGPYRRDDPAAGTKYAAHVAEIVAGLATRGRRPAAFLAESLPSVGGQIVLPSGYLAAAYAPVRAAGGLCIADEVQVGFGRLGTHGWGFETQGVVPDLVVLGKPMGNGYPLAAVVTTTAIAAAFDNGIELFSTFGGNPVACAAGLAVLDVLAEEGLQANALRVGERLLAGLRELAARHPLIGDVRGSGFFLGAELVRDRETREPATAEASYVVERLREEGILAGTDGPLHNVLKLRPPMVFDEADADFLLATLGRVLEEDAVATKWESGTIPP